MEGVATRIAPALLILAGLLGLGPSSAHAVDGVLEINQTAALAGGIGGNPGDAAGFPVLIATPGSYRLTSNLEVESIDETAVLVQADDVSLDLNGFVIRTREDCRPDCGAPGAGFGIDANGRENLAVHAGTILGMGASAIRAGDLASIRDVRAIGIGGDAIVIGNRSSLHRVLVEATGARGLVAGFGSGVYESTVFNTAGVGVYAGEASIVSRSRVGGSGSYGVHVDGRRGSVVENVVTQAGSAGVFIKDGAVVHNVISLSTGPAVFLNGGVGTVVRGNQLTENGSGVDAAGASGTVISGNSITQNNVLAINGGSNDGYAGNVLYSNGSSPPIGAVEIGENLCDGSTTCP